MKILSAAQIKKADSYTIEQEPISSIDLMERASAAFTHKFTSMWKNGTPVKVFAGPGNNGGDALAVARLLCDKGYCVEVFLFNTNGKLSPDCAINLERLRNQKIAEITEVTTSFNPPPLTVDDVVIDGLFGTGLSRPLTGGFASVVKYINTQPSIVVSIDVPSGLMCEDNTYNVMSHVIKANHTFTFQYPKLAFFFAENACHIGEWDVLDIGIKIPESEDFQTFYNLTEESVISAMIKPRPKFAHKGTMGHALLIAGQKNMAGAAILAAKACLRSGAGKLTLHTPETNAQSILAALPETVLHTENKAEHFTTPFDATPFDAMAIGPGIGTDERTSQAFIEQIRLTSSSIVIDADAINILAKHIGWIQQLPQGCILTPHKKELAGLIGTTRNSYEELQKTRELAMRHRIHIIIKGAFSIIVTPEGHCHFNPTGNPGMATAGSGDVLTGILLSLLAQGYAPGAASLLGTYLHGLAGDIAAENLCEESLIASDIISHLHSAFKKLKQAKA